jgi:hypothetical protein
MDANQGLEKIGIRKLFGLSAETPDRQSLVKGVYDRGFIPLRNPCQHEIDIPLLERLPGGFNNRAIQAVTMGEDQARSRQTES